MTRKLMNTQQWALTTLHEAENEKILKEYESHKCKVLDVYPDAVLHTLNGYRYVIRPSQPAKTQPNWRVSNRTKRTRRASALAAFVSHVKLSGGYVTDKDAWRDAYERLTETRS